MPLNKERNREMDRREKTGKGRSRDDRREKESRKRK
jgi:hypothetical protein